MDCPIDTLIKDRDPKGLYKKALAGEIKNFTGVSADAPCGFSRRGRLGWQQRALTRCDVILAFSRDSLLLSLLASLALASSTDEAPLNPELHIRTDQGTVEDSVAQIVKYLESSGKWPKIEA